MVKRRRLDELVLLLELMRMLGGRCVVSSLLSGIGRDGVVRVGERRLGGEREGLLRGRRSGSVDLVRVEERLLAGDRDRSGLVLLLLEVVMGVGRSRVGVVRVGSRRMTSKARGTIRSNSSSNETPSSRPCRASLVLRDSPSGNLLEPPS